MVVKNINIYFSYEVPSPDFVSVDTKKLGSNWIFLIGSSGQSSCYVSIFSLSLFFLSSSFLSICSTPTFPSAAHEINNLPQFHVHILVTFLFLFLFLKFCVAFTATIASSPEMVVKFQYSRCKNCFH